MGYLMMSHIDQVSLISRKESFQMTMELESVNLNLRYNPDLMANVNLD